MYKFKLTPEQFKAVLTYLKSQPVARVENGLPIMYKLENEAEHIFEQKELVPILEFLSKEPYANVAHILNSIYPLDAINKDEVDADLKLKQQSLKELEKNVSELSNQTEQFTETKEPLVVTIEKKKRGKKPKAANV